jgi:peptide/nickel transport system substrate-binding protein
MNAKPGLPTADVRVRRAVVAAIDPQAINQRVFGGTALATSAVIHEQTPGLFQGIEGPAHDPELAKRLVAEAKAAGWDGTIRLLADNSATRVDEAIAVEALLESVGFTVTVNSGQALPDVIKRVVVDRDYDLALWGPQFSIEGMWAVMNRTLNSQERSNYYNYSDPRMDAVLADLRVAVTPEEMKPILARIQEILADNPFAANLAAFEEANVFSDEVAGLELTRGSIVRFDKAYLASP